MTSRSRLGTAAVLLAITPSIVCCASTAQDSPRAQSARWLAETWPGWAGGEPVDAPARTSNTAYPNVYDNPPTRPLRALSVEQQRTSASDLDALRSHVSDQVKAAQAFDDKNTATALSDVTRGKVAADTGATPN